jgi:hypothetical protein
MLNALPESASERKLRLHACLCCRRIWHVIRAEEAHRCVEVAELFADGQATREELQAAITASMAACNRLPRPLTEPAATAINAVSRVHRSAAGGRDTALGLSAAAWAGAEAVRRWVAGDTTVTLAERRRVLSDQERARQCDYLRELFGNPFQPIVADPQWLVDASKLARHRDGERYFVLLHFRQKAQERSEPFEPGSDWCELVAPLVQMIKAGGREFNLPPRISPHGAEWLLQQVIGEATGNPLVADLRLNTEDDDYIYRLYVSRFAPMGVAHQSNTIG